MYSKFGSLEDARAVFDRIHKKDVLCWNFMLSAYSEHGFPAKVIEVYRAMDVEPNAVTYTNVLIACSALEALGVGEEVHSRVIDSRVESDLVLETALLNMYIKCRSLRNACQVFEAMKNRDVIAWNFMMAGYIDQDRDAEALRLYSRMQEAGIAANNVTLANVLKACAKLRDIDTGTRVHTFIAERDLETDAVTDTALLNMYAACGELEHARRVFDTRRDARRDAIFWTSMIASYAQAGRAGDALSLFSAMLAEDIGPNTATFTSALNACSSLAEGKKIHSTLEGRAEESEEAVQNSLVTMYARCGSVGDAVGFFREMPRRDVVSWTAMVAAYARHGLGDEALEVVQEMELEGTSPDAATFASALQACVHVGSVERGGRCFATMRGEYGVEARREHYVCMVDLLARAGRLAEAADVIELAGLGRDGSAWMALLSACRADKDAEMGRLAAQRTLPEDAPAVGSLLASICV